MSEVLFKAPAKRIFEGTPLSKNGCTITCSTSGETLREGDRVLLHARRWKGSDAWHHLGVYGGGYGTSWKQPEEEDEYDEVIAAGRLAVASDCATQAAELIIRDVDICEIHHAEGAELDE
ncbi:hypothetical protein DJ71_02300 [Halorubrum sp. E3]|nr:hypothetical protein DJ71_02300 [Halorubrum sp. E3]